MKGATSNVATNELLAKYQVATDWRDSRNGYDGHMEWNPTESMDIVIHQFRTAVINENARAIKQILKELHNITTGQIERLLALLTDRSSVEPIKEALMTAICIGNRPLVEFILSLFMEYPGEERNGCRKSKSFPSHMTPLMLACICNNFSIVQCLLLRNHFIQLPHRPDCPCDECLRGAHCMANSVILLDTYRAISSDAFLWLACTDPLLAAFNLAIDLQVCKEMENEYKVAYSDLRDNVMAFAARIVEQCWTTEEIHVLLSRKVGSPLADCELRFPRIQLALKAHMKPFLSSLGVQTTVAGHWQGMWGDYGNFKFQDFTRKLRHFAFYPILSLIHAISAGALIKTFKYPLARYALVILH
uniref:Transient receptor ion channel domain-containing protein n=1 Tax=Setaria digitata TaxID=48799 RepID=A0A915PKB1_9BILA